MRAIVHIGRPKTGTSTLQEFLFQNTDPLAAQGFRFHRNVEGRGSQYEYALAAMWRTGTLLKHEESALRYGTRTLEELEAQVAPIIAELKDYPRTWSEPVALFSSEHITGWLNSDELIKALDDLFAPVFDSVTYVVYLRSPMSALISSYSEQVKRGSTAVLEDFVLRRAQTMNYRDLAASWARVVGRDRFKVRLLESDFMTGGNLIEDYCALCGIDPAPLQRPARQNESLTATGAEVMRIMNRNISELQPDGNVDPVRDRIFREVQKMTEDDPRLALAPWAHQKVSEQVGTWMEDFRATWFPDRDRVFSEDQPPRDPAENERIRDQANDVLARMIVDAGRMIHSVTSSLGPIARGGLRKLAGDLLDKNKRKGAS